MGKVSYISAHPKFVSNLKSQAYSCYVQASELDSNPESSYRAIDLYEQAIKLDPGLAIAYINLGNIHFHQGRVIQAKHRYEKALEINPNLVEGLYNLAYIYLDQKQYGQAIPRFKRVLELDKTYVDAIFNLAICYYENGRPHLARQNFQKFLQMRPNSEFSGNVKAYLKNIETGTYPKRKQQVKMC